MNDDGSTLEITLTAQIISAYVEKNPVRATDMPGLITSVRESLERIAKPQSQKIKPAVPIKTSVKHDCIVCLEDGHRFRSLKRHLAAVHGMTPTEYREKWDLPLNYPMVAPDYAEMRSRLAKSFNFGQRKPARKGKKKAG
jgi:predicted transcriptional regulator